jgi:lysophospholipase L1-like esterase
MARLLGVTVLAALLVGLIACSQGADHNSQGGRENASRAKATTQERTALSTALERTPPAGEQSGSATGASDSWDYVALGDSLATGIGARRGYVDRYASYVRADTGVRLDVVNLGQSGQTSTQLLRALREDTSMRRALRGADVITFNIGINDLGHAGEAYANGTCGREKDEECLRAAVDEFEENWDAIIAELLSLRSTDDTIIRTVGLGYTPQVGEVFRPYLDEANRHIATTAASNDIPYAQPNLGEEYISPDGVHPNDRGYEVIADRLRALGYSPLD